MTTRYIVDVVMLALPEGQHSLSELQLVELCRGDAPHLERRSVKSIHAGVGAAQSVHAEAMRNPACVMAALIEWHGKGLPEVGKAGMLHVPGDPKIKVLEFWERPYKATATRYGYPRGITVAMAPWQQGTNNVPEGWSVGGGEWPVWTPPAYPA